MLSPFVASHILSAIIGFWQNPVLQGLARYLHSVLAALWMCSSAFSWQLEMRRPTRHLRAVCTLIPIFWASTAISADSLPTTSTASSIAPSTIVIGFVGGFVHRNDARHSEVQLVQKLRQVHMTRLHAEIFENRQTDGAHRAILKWLDTDRDGSLSQEERRGARIILYGHSWGASAAIVLARQLQQEQIPILLTVQVDSISKNGQDDQIIPANVERAVNFYQTRGLLHGRTKITAADPVHTEILGDFRFDYERQPSECGAYPWVDRHLFKGHTSIECDPAVWSKIENLIDYYLSPALTQLPSDNSLTNAKLARSH